MNEYQQAAERIVSQGMGPWPDEDWTCLVALTEKAVAQLAWGTMTYECEECGFAWDVYLTFGCEGPPALKDVGLAVAVPFIAGTCEVWRPPEGEELKSDLTNLKRCGGAMRHVRWQDDQRFEPSLIPDDAPRFVLPRSSAGGTPSGHLEIPEPALVRARQAGSEP